MRNVKSTLFKLFGMLFALSLLFAFSAASAVAAAYPGKTIRLVIPFPPGGSNDIVGRVIASQLGEKLGKQVIVDNRGGAGGTIGTEIVANAPPDGHTLLIVSAAYPINTSTYARLPYDPVKSFVPVAKLGEGPNVLSIYPGLPVNSVKELIALAKKEPGKLFYSAAGVGSFQHLASELFVMMAGIDVVGVQFKGGGPAMIDTMGGHTQISLGSLIQNLPHIQSGKLKALGTGGRKRTSILPNIPTIAEAGVPGYEANNFWGILAPAGTPQAIIERLNKELAVILASAETQKTFLSQGAETDYVGPVEFGKFIAAETTKWAMVVKKAGVRME